MKTAHTALVFVLLPVAALLAQGPPRGRGPGGPGGPGPMMQRGPGMPGGGGVVTGAPYSAVEVVQSQETLADGNVIQRKHQTNVYRDSAGRVRTEETITPDASTGKAPYTVVTILDYVAGKRYELNSTTMTGHESPLRVPRSLPQAAGSAPGGRRGGGAGNAQAEQLRPNVVRTTLNPQNVNGVLASGMQHSETIPAGAIGNTRPIQTSRTTWVSNELKVPVQIKSSDPRFGTTDMELTNIVQSEPSASLFMVPGGYTMTAGGGFGPGGPRPQMRGPRPTAPLQ